MNIAGKFARVSDTTYREGTVLVGFCGNAHARDLNPVQVEYIKAFYVMEGANHSILESWPEDIKPAYPAARQNFRNGYLLLTR